MELKNILVSVTNYLKEHNVPYVIVGGFSAIVWGRTRTTFDIDIIIDQNKVNLEDFVDFFQNIGLMTSLYDIETAFKEKSHCSILVESAVFLSL